MRFRSVSENVCARPAAAISNCTWEASVATATATSGPSTPPNEKSTAVRLPSAITVARTGREWSASPCLSNLTPNTTMRWPGGGLKSKMPSSTMTASETPSMAAENP